MGVRIGRTPDGVWWAVGSVPMSANQRLVVREIVEEEPIRRVVFPAVAREVSRHLRETMGDNFEVGLNLNPFHYAGRTIANGKLAASAIVKEKARKKLLKKVGTGVKKTLKVAKDVYESPYFAAGIGVVSAAVPGAQGLLPAYALSRAALKLAEQIKKGDPQAIATGAQLAQAAAGGIPEAQATLVEVQKAMGSIDQTISDAPELLANAAASGYPRRRR